MRCEMSARLTTSARTRHSRPRNTSVLLCNPTRDEKKNAIEPASLAKDLLVRNTIHYAVSRSRCGAQCLGTLLKLTTELKNPIHQERWLAGQSNVLGLPSSNHQNRSRFREEHDAGATRFCHNHKCVHSLYSSHLKSGSPYTKGTRGST